jgi:SapC
MKTMMIFERLVNLHRERHRHLRLDAARVDHSFAQHTNSVPLAMEEVPDAALFYPCVFIEREGTHAMTVLLGLRAQQNLFVGADKQWLADTYVPAHVRRYPFALAETPTPDNFLICLDEACAGLGDTEGQPLFLDDAAEGPLLAEVRTFLLNLHQAFVRSNAWCKEVAELGLLTPRALTWTDHRGESQELSGFLAIDEERLRALPTEVTQRWMSTGQMAVAWAHLLSLGHARTLAARQKLVDLDQPAPATQLPAEPAAEASQATDPSPAV